MDLCLIDKKLVVGYIGFSYVFNVVVVLDLILKIDFLFLIKFKIVGLIYVVLKNEILLLEVEIVG